jgi:hypothetical protein
MNSLAQEAILVGLARRLEQEGSWSGETHLQKSAYLASELLGVPFDFEFILYKHGPFSFELRDELDDMRANGLLTRVPQGPKYGPRLLVSERGDTFEQRFAKTMERYGASLDWIADNVGDRGVLDLERLATALWVTRELGEGASVDTRAHAVVDLKPHVKLDVAAAAVEEIDKLRNAVPDSSAH